MYFFYDGTYVGFLTTVYEIYHHGTSHLEGILVEGGEVPLFGAQSIVVTRLPDAEKERFAKLERSVRASDWEEIKKVGTLFASATDGVFLI